MYFSPMLRLPFTKLDPKATTPRKGTPHAAGHDLFPLEEVVLPPKTTNFPVPTGVALDTSVLSEGLPAGLSVYGRVAPRSGLAFRHGVDVLAGVIDRDYRDQIHVILTNVVGDLCKRKSKGTYLWFGLCGVLYGQRWLRCVFQLIQCYIIQ